LRPIIERTGGKLVKFEADNLFAVYDEVERRYGWRPR
jgi:hypothetical protein